MSDEFILRGVPEPEVPNCSVAEYVLPKIRNTSRDRVVLVDGETGETMTAWQYLTESLRLLQGMKGLGLKQNDTVAMMCRNSFPANEIMLATWLGALPVAPINGFMKVAEMRHIFDLIKPKLIFCEEQAVHNVAAAVESLFLAPIIVIVDKEEHSPYTYMNYKDVKEEVDVESFEPEPVESPATQVLVIAPSSGTSGLPKGIGITHTNVIYQDAVMENMTLFPSDAIFLCLSHFFWVTGTLGLIRSLSVGGVRVFIKNINPKTVLNAIDKFKPVYTIIAPLTLAALMKYPEFNSYDTSSIRYVLLAGSPLTEGVSKYIKKTWPELKIYNVYGLTESTGMTCLNSDDDLSVGKVCSGVHLKITDIDTGTVLGPNTSGEICMKSPGIMLGYVGNEEGTSESIDEEGWLHTGDIGYYDENGKIYVIDRIKEMIKVRDMQVAPAEIENVIAGIPGVIEVGVVGIPHETDIFRLRALVVKHKSFNVTEEDVHARVESTLSDYKKLTGGVFFVDAIPKTETGKISRKELRLLAEKYTSEQDRIAT
ncbi:hypothetical protein RUM43_002334 [Polyplax serrata]|uniref:Uncharacterized protein n=1 Tax=Polyplax serrata TaxID=468196 RepID=A0AAN8NYP1_POLSC